ncbi:MAG: organic solvent tolerance protein [Moraxellaceae bacterium]|nr:organic solvent tolerance protein [Pseudobdellovibrionaceae bacterium]
MKQISLLFVAVMMLTLGALARPMPQRLGIGIKDNTSQSIPSLTALYNMNDQFAFFGGFGFDTKKDYSTTQINVGIRHIVFHETNLHFYTGGQFAIVNLEDPINGKQNGFEVNALLGAEFFFAGLENIGFSFEGGIGLSSYKETRVRTIGDHPLKAGILFYF